MKLFIFKRRGQLELGIERPSRIASDISTKYNCGCLYIGKDSLSSGDVLVEDMLGGDRSNLTLDLTMEELLEILNEVAEKKAEGKL